MRQFLAGREGVSRLHRIEEQEMRRFVVRLLRGPSELQSHIRA